MTLFLVVTKEAGKRQIDIPGNHIDSIDTSLKIGTRKVEKVLIGTFFKTVLQ